MSTANTRENVLAAAKQALIDTGYAQLSTRRIAETAGVPLSQIHYHFGSKQNLMLEVLAEENRKLLERQANMYAGDTPLWKQWEQACDYLDDDLESGYVRVLQEMLAVGWSDAEIATAVREMLDGWSTLLTDVATREVQNWDGDDMPKPDHLAMLVAAAFIGAEALILLGQKPELIRDSLRSVGDQIRRIEEED